MPKGIPNKRYTPEFKQLVVETMLNEKLSYSETERQFEVVRSRITAWERIYLSEGPEGFSIERRGRGSKGRPKKLPDPVEKDLLAEVQRLRAEVDYLKNLQALVLEDDTGTKNAGSSETKADTFSGTVALNRSITQSNILLSLETTEQP